MITRNRYVTEDMSRKYGNTIKWENVCGLNVQEVYTLARIARRKINSRSAGLRLPTRLTHTRARAYTQYIAVTRFMDTVNKSIYVLSLFLRGIREGGPVFLSINVFSWKIPRAIVKFIYSIFTWCSARDFVVS